MSTPIINAQMDAINGSMATLKGDLATLRPLIKTLKENALNAYATESLSNQAVASFTDGANNVPVKSLSVAITPIQNLNGQANPYPAGGGKNLLPIPTTAITSNGVTVTPQADGTVKVTTTTVTSNTEILLGTVSRDNSKSYAISGCPSGGSTSTYRQMIRLYANGSSLQTVSDTGSGYIVPTALQPTADEIKVSVWIASGQNNLTFIFKPMVEIGSIVTTFAPYSNICPITGWTGANVTRVGVNLCDEEWEDGYITQSGNLANYVNAIRSKNYNPCSPNTQYYYVKGTNTNGYSIAWYDKNKTFISRTSETQSLTSPANAYYFKLSLYNYKLQDSPTYNHDISINYPSTDHDYHAYNGNTYPFSLGQTVYGGTLDVTTGVLTVRLLGIALGDASFGTSGSAFQISKSGLGYPALGNMSCVLMCDRYAYSDTAVDKKMTQTNGYIRFYDSDYSSAADFKSAMASANAQLVYELATPITVQLSATEVTTLLGQNNIWADTGDITEVTIRCDTALYIQKLVG